MPRGLYHPGKWHELTQPQPPDPCTYGVQGAGEPAPQTTAVQGRPRETSRRKEPPGLWPPQEPPCRVHSRWPQVPPQRERRRALGPGTRGCCVPTAPAAFQEQYCWHQADSLRRQRIHGPFMRGTGMIYCLGEGAGAGGWSPSVLAPARPAPRACSLPWGPTHVSKAEGLARGITSPQLGVGQSGSPCPICTLPACSLPHLRGPGMCSLPGHPLWLGGQGACVPCGATADRSSPQGWGGKGQQRRVLWQGCTRRVGCRRWHNPPLFSCWRGGGCGGAAGSGWQAVGLRCHEGLFVCRQLLL